MNILDLIIYSLATCEIIEIWRHGSIFASLRARVELWNNFLGSLLLCGFCLVPWVSLLVLGLVFLSDSLIVVIHVFAIARLANLINDITYSFSRTPKEGKELEEGSKEFEKNNE